MRNLILLFLVILLASNCRKEYSDKHPCYNPEMEANHSGICFTDCPGYIGCDGEFYCNECDANRVGIK